jgi:hypothetical protein
MSWEVLLFKSAHSSTSEMPNDFRPDPIGSLEEVRKSLHDALPDIDFGDPSWGVLDGRGWSIEFSIGRNEPVESVTLHVRGSDDAISAIRAAAEALRARVLDFSTAEFLSFDADPAAGLRKWRAFRDRAVKE